MKLGIRMRLLDPRTTKRNVSGSKSPVSSDKSLTFFAHYAANMDKVHYFIPALWAMRLGNDAKQKRPIEDENEDEDKNEEILKHPKVVKMLTAIDTFGNYCADENCSVVSIGPCSGIIENWLKQKLSATKDAKVIGIGKDNDPYDIGVSDEVLQDWINVPQGFECTPGSVAALYEDSILEKLGQANFENTCFICMMPPRDVTGIAYYFSEAIKRGLKKVFIFAENFCSTESCTPVSPEHIFIGSLAKIDKEYCEVEVDDRQTDSTCFSIYTVGMSQFHDALKSNMPIKINSFKNHRPTLFVDSKSAAEEDPQNRTPSDNRGAAAEEDPQNRTPSNN